MTDSTHENSSQSSSADDAPMRKPKRKQYWRKGDLLIVRRGARLPAHVCLATGRPADEPPTQVIFRSHGAPSDSSWLVLLLSLPMFFGFWLTGRGVQIECGLSKEVIARRKKGYWVIVIGALATSLELIGALDTASGVLFGCAIITLILSLAIGQQLQRITELEWIRKGRVALRVDPQVFEGLGLADASE